MLLQLPFAAQRSPRQIIIADDCFELLKIPADRVVQVVIKSTEKLFGSKFLCFEPLIISLFLRKIHLSLLFKLFCLCKLAFL